MVNEQSVSEYIEVNSSIAEKVKVKLEQLDKRASLNEKVTVTLYKSADES